MSLQSTDQIADLITRIRNAIMVGKTEISVPTSKLKVAVIDVLKKTHFIDDYKLEKSSPRDNLVVKINQPGTPARINAIEKVSRPGQRIYSSAADLKPVKSGRGISIVSTSRGVMTGSEAKQNHLGGEVLVKVY